MAFIPTVTCRKCRQQYSAMLKKCPHCGARREPASQRTAPSTGSTQKGSPAAQRNSDNSKWQLVFGLIILAAVMLSVIALITTSLDGRESDPNSPDGAIVSPAPSVDPSLVSPSASPSPTPSPSPSFQASSIALYYGTEPMSGFTTVIGESVQLSATVYPISAETVVEWRSTDENVASVDATGNITGVGVGACTIIAECGGQQAECSVIVKESW